MAARHLVVWNRISGKIGNIQAGDTGLFAEDMEFAKNLTVGGVLNGRDITVDGAKLDLLTVGVPPNVVTMAGNWDASLASFPVATLKGQSYICSVAGTVDTIPFEIGDRIIAKINTPSTLLSSSWHIEGTNDNVKSVAGRIGNVVLVEADITDLQDYLLSTDINTISKLNVLVGTSIIVTGNPALTDPRPPKYPINGGITAYATGGQANAVELIGNACNVCTVCATANDSVKLPTAIAELPVIFTNRGVAICNLYPNVSDAIESLGPNNPITVNPLETLTLLAIDNTNWIIL